MAEKPLILCDTNIIIDFYKERTVVVDELRAIGQDNIAISIVTAGELLFGALNKKERNQINKDLDHLHLFHINATIGIRFIDLMNKYSLSHNLSLPDGLIAATALVEDIFLYTHNRKDFKYIKGIQLYE